MSLKSMNDISPLHISIITLTFLLAGMVKGVTGMGLPTVAIGLLCTIMQPLAAVTLLIVPTFVTNIWQLFAGPAFGALASRLWTMMLGIVGGTLAGSAILTRDTGGWTTMGLGVALMVYAAISLFDLRIQISAQREPVLSPFIGLATGVIAGGTGVFVIPAVPYIQALGLNRDDLIQALGLTFTVSTIALTAGLAGRGAFELGNIGESALVVAPALLGMWGGQIIRKHISPAAFRRWFLICLLLLGLDLLLRPLL